MFPALRAGAGPGVWRLLHPVDGVGDLQPVGPARHHLTLPGQGDSPGPGAAPGVQLRGTLVQGHGGGDPVGGPVAPADGRAESGGPVEFQVQSGTGRSPHLRRHHGLGRQGAQQGQGQQGGKDPFFHDITSFPAVDLLL